MICALYFLFLCCCCLFSYFIVVLFLICVLLFLYGFFLLFFFFSSRRRHTRLVSDWSSDVCSSDLVVRRAPGDRLPAALALRLVELARELPGRLDRLRPARDEEDAVQVARGERSHFRGQLDREIGRAHV